MVREELCGAADDAAKKERARLDPDMEIIAVDALRRQVGNGYRPELRKHEAALITREAGSRSEVVAIPSELKTLEDNRLYTGVDERDVDNKVFSGLWVLKRLGGITSKARYV